MNAKLKLKRFHYTDEAQLEHIPRQVDEYLSQQIVARILLFQHNMEQKVVEVWYVEGTQQPAIFDPSQVGRA